jgi:hypothetical protein
MGQMRNMYKILIERSEGKRPLEDLSLDEGVMIKWIINEEELGCGLDSNASG